MDISYTELYAKQDFWRLANELAVFRRVRRGDALRKKHTLTVILKAHTAWLASYTGDPLKFLYGFPEPNINRALSDNTKAASRATHYQWLKNDRYYREAYHFLFGDEYPKTKPSPCTCKLAADLIYIARLPDEPLDQPGVYRELLANAYSTKITIGNVYESLEQIGVFKSLEEVSNWTPSHRRQFR